MCAFCTVAAAQHYIIMCQLKCDHIVYICAIVSNEKNESFLLSISTRLAALESS